MTGARHGMCELTRHGMGAVWLEVLRLFLRPKLKHADPGNVYSQNSHEVDTAVYQLLRIKVSVVINNLKQKEKRCLLHHKF
jgi:hypothetical protein